MAAQLKIPFLNSVPSRSIALFTRQLSAMLGAGLPLSKSLKTLIAQTENKYLKAALTQAANEVQSGKPLAEALKKQAVFSNLYCAMVGVGESSGSLDNVLKKLAVHLEKQEKLKRKLVSAATYPVVILGISVVVIIALLTYVIPTFATMFIDMGKELPQTTQTIISLSGFVSTNIVYILMVLVVCVLGGYWFYQNPNSRVFLDKSLLTLPLIGQLVRKSAVARFSSTLGSLLQAGVPLVEAMRITAGTAGNLVVEKAILKSLSHITSGKQIAAPLEETGVFPPMVTQMVAIGEETGKLPEMLSKISEFYDDEIDAAVERFTSIIEPILILGLGAVVAGMLIAMYLPMFDMIGNVQ